MERPTLDKIRAKGREAYIRDLRKRGVTKEMLLDEIAFPSSELVLGYRYEVEACAAGDRLRDELDGVMEDCRRAEAVADEYIRRLELERATHSGTRKRAARVLHGAALIFGDAAPDLQDMPRGGEVAMTADRRRLMGERAGEAIVPPGRRKSDYDWPA